MTGNNTFDVIIVGGSYSGLAAGMALGRALRKVLIIDDGKSCNRQTLHSHNFLTNDGKTPTEIAALANLQVSRYDTVKFFNRTAINGTKTESGFGIQVTTGETFAAKKLIFATGIRDLLLPMDGIAACWGISVIHCPYCHGYEIRQEKTGVLGNGDSGYDLIRLISNWTKDLTLFTNGLSTLSAEQREKLRYHQINMIEKEQWIDFSIAENLFMLAIYLTAPQVENDRLSQRTKSGMRQGLKQGRWLWQAPYGYSNNTQTNLIDINVEKATIIRMCFDLMATGVFKAEEVRRKAKEKGLNLTKQGFLNLLQNAFYTGKIRVPAFKDEPEELRFGLHEAIIDENVFISVQNVLNGKRKTYKGNTKDDCLPLIGILYCPKCDQAMTGSGSKGNGGIYHYYHCQRKYGCKNSFKAGFANSSFQEYLANFEPSSEVLELYSHILKDVFKSNEIDRNSEIRKADGELASIENKIQILVSKNIDGVIDDDTYRKTKDIFQNQKNDCLARKQVLKTLPDQLSNYLSYGLSFIGNLSSYYGNADLNTKKKIIGSIFPEKIYFEENSYRTTKINSVIELICNADAGFRNRKRSENSDQSTVAPSVGLEPTTL